MDCACASPVPDRTAAPTPAAAPLLKKSRRLRALARFALVSDWDSDSWRALSRFFVMAVPPLRPPPAALLSATRICLCDGRLILSAFAVGAQSHWRTTSTEQRA